MEKPVGHPAVAIGRVGVLLVNLGTPDAPEAGAVRRYLAEFLWDRRVVEIPRVVWWLVLHGIILRTRPAKSAHAYAQVWGPDGSPLASITRAQAEDLQARLGSSAVVDWAMRYGRPAMAEKLAGLQAQGCDRVLIAPMYPQYCGATTASVIDKLGEALAAMRWQPAIRTLPPYYADAAYIEALRADTAAQLRALAFRPEVLVLSFHGMPEATLHKGDPYHCHCRKTARLLGEALAGEFGDIRVETAFQSRFGRAKWLEPSTESVLRAEAEKGTKRLAVAAPGFAADCVETLEELAIRGREVFGADDYAVLSCLNAGAPGMGMLEALVRRELSGWA